MVMFICSLAEYDQYLTEEKYVVCGYFDTKRALFEFTPFQNRLHDSLKLFKYVSCNDYFHKSSILLILNKKDIFAEKISIVPLQTCFPQYNGECVGLDGELRVVRILFPFR